MGNRQNLDTEKTRNLTGKLVNKAKELAISEFVLVPFDEMMKIIYQLLGRNQIIGLFF